MTLAHTLVSAMSANLAASKVFPTRTAALMPPHDPVRFRAGGMAVHDACLVAMITATRSVTSRTSTRAISILGPAAGSQCARSPDLTAVRGVALLIGYSDQCLTMLKLDFPTETITLGRSGTSRSGKAPPLTTNLLWEGRGRLCRVYGHSVRRFNRGCGTARRLRSEVPSSRPLL